MYCVNIYCGSSRSNELSTTAKFLTSTSNPASCAININYCAGDHFSKVLYSLFWPILLLLPILEKKMLRPKNSNVNSTSRRQDNTRVTIRSSQDAPFKTSVNATALWSVLSSGHDCHLTTSTFHCSTSQTSISKYQDVFAGMILGCT